MKEQDIRDGYAKLIDRLIESVINDYKNKRVSKDEAKKLLEILMK